MFPDFSEPDAFFLMEVDGDEVRIATDMDWEEIAQLITELLRGDEVIN